MNIGISSNLDPYRNEIVFRNYFNISVVEHLVSQKKYILSSTDKIIWDLIANGIMFKDLMIKCSNIFNVSQEKISNDVENFCMQLYRERIITIDNQINVTTSKPAGKQIGLLRHPMIVEESINNKRIMSVLFELTYKCNLKCIHCYIDDAPHDGLSMQKIEDIIDELCIAKCYQIIFSGGEALLRNDITEILTYARSKNLKVGLLSNGTLFDKAICEVLKENKISVKVSLYGCYAKTHDNITGVKGSFDKVMESIEMLNKYRVRTSSSYMIMKENYSDLKNIEVLNNKGLYPGFDVGIFQTHNKNRSVLEHRAEEELLQWCYDNGFLEKPEKALCMAGFGKAKIDPLGNVYPCEFVNIPIGNLFKESLQNIWFESKEINQFRSLELHKSVPEDCNNCKYLEDCNRCPGISLMESGNLLAPSSYSCKMLKSYYAEKEDMK